MFEPVPVISTQAFINVITCYKYIPGTMREAIGPATVAVEPKQMGTEDGKLRVSATYRNKNAVDGLPTTVRTVGVWVLFVCFLTPLDQNSTLARFVSRVQS